LTRDNPCHYRYAGCGAAVAKGARCCETCRLEHARRAAEWRARCKRAKACTVCGARAVVVNGSPLTLCKVHREYYRARATSR
jgi:hypothetical protein